MWAVLGEVQFELLTSMESMDQQTAADYAEHALIGSKPRLQHTGDKLDEYHLQMQFHAAYCDPEAELRKLLDLVRSRKARQLVLGNGLNKGWMVATETKATSRQTDAQGTLIALEASMTLREYVVPPLPRMRASQERREARERTASEPRHKAAAPPARPAGAGRGWINPDGVRAPRE